MLKFLASHDMDTKRGKNGAFTRKRPGQACGSDHPCQQQQSLRGPPAPQPRGHEPGFDYQEAVPVGMSRRGGAPSRHASRAPDYEEVVPVGMSKRGGGPPPSQCHSASRGPPQLSRCDSRAANQSLRPSLRQDPRSRSGRDHDSAAIARDLGGLSIHEPQQQRSHHYVDVEGESDDEGHQHQASRMRGSVVAPRPRVSFMEPTRPSLRERSRYDNRRSRR